jgi:hypothetical protein
MRGEKRDRNAGRNAGGPDLPCCLPRLPYHRVSQPPHR